MLRIFRPNPQPDVCDEDGRKERGRKGREEGWVRRDGREKTGGNRKVNEWRSIAVVNSDWAKPPIFGWVRCEVEGRMGKRVVR